MNIQTLTDNSLRTIALVAPLQAVKPAAPPESERVKAAAQQIDSYLKSSGRRLEFRVNEKSGRVVVTVHNSFTGELIRQIPNDETLRIADNLADPVNGGNALLDVLA